MILVLFQLLPNLFIFVLGSYCVTYSRLYLFNLEDSVGFEIIRCLGGSIEPSLETIGACNSKLLAHSFELPWAFIQVRDE